MNRFLHHQPPTHLSTPSRSPSPALPPPVPPMTFQKPAILHALTNQPIFTITASKSSLSGKKNAFTLHRSHSARPMGSFRLSSLELSKIEYEVNGAANRMAEQSLLTSGKWTLSPVAFPHKTWTWRRKHETFTLTDEEGVKVASVVEGNFVLEIVGLHELAVDEVVLCAYAMWQKRRREKGDAEEADAAGEVIGAVLGG